MVNGKVQVTLSEDKPNRSVTKKKKKNLSERDFAKLDQLPREKRNASLLALEAHILFSKNMTCK